MDKILSLTRKDFEWDYYSGSGAGGQHRNKHQNCVRVYHPPSGARGNCQDFRERKQNEREAFRRMATSKEMTQWLKIESSKKIGIMEDIEDTVDRLMNDKNLKVEVKDEKGRWVPWMDQILTEQD